MKILNQLILKLILFSVILSFTCFSALKAETQEFKIGFIDLQKVFAETEEFKQTFQELRRIQQSKSDEIKQKERELKQREYELEVKMEMVPEDSANQLRQGFIEDVKEFQNLLRSENEEFEKEKAKKLEPINMKLKSIIESIAKSENYAFVFKLSDLIYANPKYDITAKVIEMMNKQ